MRHTEDKVERLRQLLKQQPLDNASICEQLTCSQPTASRLLAQIGPELVRVGAARSSRYALKRSLPDLGGVLPIFAVNPDGTSAPFGQLQVLHSDWYLFTTSDGKREELILGLPFWLQDLRPQGFLGRLIPAMHPDLPLPSSILAWADDDTLYFAARRGEDLTGNLVLGNESYRRYVSAGSLPSIAEMKRTSHYQELANAANAGDAPGSSAGGEQAKFTALIARADGRKEHVIVKFSPSINTAAGRRWADLLIAEHLALQTLRQYKLAATSSQIVFGPQRVFLESARFDREGEFGRLPIVSLAGVDTLIGAIDQRWSDSTELLQAPGWLSKEDWQTICLLDVFGALIGNSDRHPGNLSLFWQLNAKGQPQFTLAPVYDMLPMFYRPNSQGEIVNRTFSLAVLDRLPMTKLAQAWQMALSFWQAVAQDFDISPDFKTVAARHAAVLQNLRF